MKHIILLCFVSFSFTICYAQNSYTLNDLQVSWEQNTYYNYFLENVSQLDSISDIDKVNLRSLHFYKEYKFIWSDGSFDYYSVRDYTTLQEDNYFSFPVHWAKYSYGLIVHQTDSGDILSTFNTNPDMTYYEWRNIHPIKVLPIKNKTIVSSLVPNISSEDMQQLDSMGSQVTLTPNGVFITSGQYNINIDTTNNIISEEYIDYQGYPVIKSSYFIEDGNYFIKIMEEIVTNMSFPNGICYLEIKTTYYNNIEVIRDGQAEPRSEKLTYDKSKNRVKIYPNPSKGIYYIKSGRKNSENVFIVLSIIDINGNQHPFEVEVYNRNTVVLRPSFNIPGTYFVTYSVNGNRYTQKIIFIK